MERRIGVYVCHCGSNIAGTVDVGKVVEFARTLNSVVIARDYRFMCSDPGQELIEKDIKELGLNRVVVASCSPQMHEPTFRRVCREAGLNPYLFEMANIREHCSWVTEDNNRATDKAKALVSAAVRRVYYHEPLETKEVPVNPNTLIVGGGIAGIQAALEIADSEHKVYVVEKEPSIGGHMIQLDKTFPTLDCSACILTPKMTSVGSHSYIELMSYSEVAEVSGFVGNFKVKVRKKPRYVDVAECTGCGECVNVCPVEVPSEFDLGLSKRKAIYRLFPQAVPAAFVIDKQGYPPCRVACPIGVNPCGYVALVSQGKFKEAAELVRRATAFPGVVARFCPRPCERSCKLGDSGEPLAIRALKKFIADYELKVGRERVLPVKRTKEDKVAIIGSGPAGLSCAYDLVRQGYAVTVYEAQARPGGLLLGFAEERLPKAVVDGEIGCIQELGVEFQLNTKVTNIKQLFDQGYKVILLAYGRDVDRQLLPKELALSSQGRVVVDPVTLETSIKGIFAAGGMVSGRAEVVGAIADGKRAAVSIDRYLRRVDLREGREITKEEKKGSLSKTADLGLDEKTAMAEASQCLYCAVCSECLECIKVCERKAIHHEMKEEIVELEVGNIIVATGYSLFDPTPLKQYGYGRLDNVITSLEFERVVNAAGPTGGKVLLKDGREPESVAIIHCVGSRDENYHEYCSRVCCMYSMKFAHLVKEHIHGCQVYEFYIDIRSPGKGFEEFYNRVLREGTTFFRGRPGEVTNIAETPAEKGKLIVQFEDTLVGKQRRLPVDMVILSCALEAQKDALQVGRMFNISCGKEGFFIERHPKLDPVATMTDGVFVVGCCQGPKDIPDTVAQASAAAARVLAFISKGKVEIEAAIAVIDEEKCSGCRICNLLCPYNAISFIEDKKVSRINEALCKGCGTCVASCPSSVISHQHFTTEEIMAELEGILV